ncbi:Putative amidase domain-containing protein [Marininema mesophilum]|uniref:Putative amidase domain-containing protein n=1 Tax=Marininema mesophilum TaxID=1048340 RepID=A0A1H3C6H6_9BACL|nr:amidase domain-containing protein [Marininema mesophilum]SDX49691.1 Putative amidase domain-containing protein [Marininema mesophilum]
MDRPWRQPVLTWFRGQNQVWVEGDSDRLFSWVLDGDADWVVRERRRWQRVREQQHLRKIRPIKGETRVRILSEGQEQDGHVVVNVAVHQRFFYLMKDTVCDQEELQGYCLHLLEGNDGWAILDCSLIEEMDTERDKVWSCYQPHPEENVVRGGYNRMQAVQYAETWWNGANPRYRKFEDDCTNFISQCLHAGGISMDYGSRRDSGWWYRGSRENWSYSWAVAHGLVNWLSRSSRSPAEIKQDAMQLSQGDIICYDWDGDGRWSHNTIVTAIDASGMPLVNAHTVNSRQRYWDYRDSHAWTPKIKYRFFHIAGN